jgi:hypothetical protein
VTFPAGADAIDADPPDTTSWYAVVTGVGRAAFGCTAAGDGVIAATGLFRRADPPTGRRPVTVTAVPDGATPQGSRFTLSQDPAAQAAPGY